MAKRTATLHKLKLRQQRAEDYDDIHQIMHLVYGETFDTLWTREDVTFKIKRFPEGQICIEDKGKVVAAAFSLIVDYEAFDDNHTYKDILGKRLNNHDPEGDYLYGIEVMVHPDYQGMRLGRRLYDARKELCESLNLKGILIGARIPGYDDHHQDMGPREYIERVRNKELHDPVLSFQLSNDFHIKRLIRDYMPTDTESRGNAVLLEWSNIYFEERPRPFGAKKTYARLAAVQWQMRPFRDFDDFLTQMEFFVDTVSSYQVDILLFPELFILPLLSHCEDTTLAGGIRELARFSERVREAACRMALEYNTNIVAGSVPLLEDGNLCNVSYLCRRDGTWDYQKKLHVTPTEFEDYALTGGNSLKVFDTDIGKIGILICYDVEFPELPRILADQGMQILLVPFWTDTKNAYLRVRRCAQARAIENECYVALAGSVGNLPKIGNLGVQYSQAAIFTPSDFAFPHDAVVNEATPNTETTLIADLDLHLLTEVRETGSVRNLLSRRTDLYQLKLLK